MKANFGGFYHTCDWWPLLLFLGAAIGTSRLDKEELSLTCNWNLQDWDALAGTNSTKGQSAGRADSVYQRGAGGPASEPSEICVASCLFF